MYYIIKVQIKGVTKPPVWRRFEASPTARLSELHHAIIYNFGWTGGGCHEFCDLEGGWCTEYDYDDEESVFWDRPGPDLKLKEFFDTCWRAGYIYDNSWAHVITLEKAVRGESRDDIVCVAGRGACPPYECGSAGDYQYLKRLMASTDPEDAQELADYAEEIGFSVEGFDPDDCPFPARRA